MYCDFLCDHTAHVENTTWLVVSYARDVVGCASEGPMQEFVLSLHASPSSSGLLLQAVVNTCRRGDPPSYLRNVLRTLEHAHPHQTGKLLVFLASRFLSSPLAALARQANSLACSKVEAALGAGQSDSLPQMILESELSEVLDLLRSGRVYRRYSRLVSLLNRCVHFSCFNHTL